MRAAVAWALLLAACASDTAYAPSLVARGEITLSYRGGFRANAQGRELAHGLRWRGLERYVACVDEARVHAHAAARAGDRALGFAITGGILGGVSAGGLVGLVDEPRRWVWLGTGLGTAALGALLSGLSRLARNEANAHAVDAINFYNDRVGSLGATCADLTYPSPTTPTAPTSPP